jgi:EAL domain-containing protein (putative c-di-GMP-specific phosphodiesterase class I)
VAEKSDLIVELGARAIQEACRQFVEWRRRGLPPLTIAVNVSARLFGDEDLADRSLSLAVDDFGTVYSSLAYLRRFPAHRIKIDKAFIDTLSETEAADTRTEGAAIVRAIVATGSSPGVSIIAEGVEIAAQLDRPSALGCHEA